ncbi:hypothetical protein [Streptomyces sp. NPDC058424]|uniref:hypothetical protein n=1 Tax=Streptomyces sp. NPDC058424 TaxID=3346491 RepID=UPI003668BFD3
MHSQLRDGQAVAAQLVPSRERAEEDTLLKKDSCPPEDVWVVLVVAGRIDLVPGRKGNEHEVVVDREVRRTRRGGQGL